jgi:hypothetical protein
MSVPERDIVDRRIEGARARVTDETLPLSPDLRNLAHIACDLAEAICRSIRDHDDTQATVVAPAIREGFNDLATIVGDELGPITHALTNKGTGKRNGLFG